MSDEIRVYVVGLKGRKNLSMRYTDPDTRRQVSKSTGTHRQREAERIAAKWESEINKKRPSRSPQMSWEYFRDYYEENALGALRPGTVTSYRSTLAMFEKLVDPAKLCDLKTERVTDFATKLRLKGVRETTVAKHLRSLKVVARWANRQGLLAEVPFFEMPKRTSSGRMKGRPITGEEFDRMIKATPDEVGEQASDSWLFLLRGLWWSGLRLNEALNLRWDRQPGCVSLMLNGKNSVLAFEAESQKSGKTELVPLAPEAVSLFEPFQKASGFVFNPLSKTGEPLKRTRYEIGKRISDIGEAAGIIVNTETKKTASAHDFRRSFAARWSRLIMPSDLKALMRHATIETTMTYYVGQNAADTSNVLWKAAGRGLGDTLGDTRPKKRKKKKRKKSK